MSSHIPSSVTSTVVGALPSSSITKIDGLPVVNNNNNNNPFLSDGVILKDGGSTVCPPVIPPAHTNRTLIVCFDGTGDQFDNDNSNVIKFVSLLKKDNMNQQLVYYQPGIGTYESHPNSTTFRRYIRKMVDLMVANSLKSHVTGGYEFLMQNYIAGDKICLFGFSRGAYTARSLAGMLHKVGLLPAGNFQQVPFAYHMYQRADDVGWEQSNEFKKAFSIDVPIEFIGVWDTVDSVGLVPKRLPFTTSNTIVRTFRHAVSLDEHRAKFKANLWNRPTKVEQDLGTKTVASDTEAFFAKWNFSKKEEPNDRHQDTLESIQSDTDIYEVWFAGCHCDVGGGSVSNKTRHSLARIPLRWMIRECFKTNTGIMFHSNKLFEIGLDPSTLYPLVLPRPPPLPFEERRHLRIPDWSETPVPIKPTKSLSKKYDLKLAKESEPFLGSEEEEEARDALSPIYDQLQIKKAWWILEVIPLTLRYQRPNDEWVTRWTWNFGRPRHIPLQLTNGFNVHRSVMMRMEAEFENERWRAAGKRYVPKAVWKVFPKYVP